VQPPPPEVCPVCGAEVPRNALACRECGADYNSGWKQDPGDGLDLRDDDFDYDAFIEEEFGDKPRQPLSPLWIVTAVVLVLAFLLLIGLSVL